MQTIRFFSHRLPKVKGHHHQHPRDLGTRKPEAHLKVIGHLLNRILPTIHLNNNNNSFHPTILLLNNNNKNFRRTILLKAQLQIVSIQPRMFALGCPTRRRASIGQLRNVPASQLNSVTENVKIFTTALIALPHLSQLLDHQHLPLAR
jgi:hypothetical protein